MFFLPLENFYFFITICVAQLKIAQLGKPFFWKIISRFFFLDFFRYNFAGYFVTRLCVRVEKTLIYIFIFIYFK